MRPVAFLNVVAAALLAGVIGTRSMQATPAPSRPVTTPVRPSRRRRRSRRGMPAPKPVPPATPATTPRSGRRGTARPNDPRTPAAAQGCETCHGPGEAHASDPEKIKPRQFDQDFGQGSDRHVRDLPQPRPARALGGQPARSAQRVVRHVSQRARAEVGKAQLKTVDQTEAVRHLPPRQGRQARRVGPHAGARRQDGVLVVPQPARLDQRAAAARPATGSTSPARAATPRSAGRTCSSTPAISGDSCATCHDPHGSTNDRMLVAKLPFLCQRCHNHTRHPSTIYDNRVLQTQQSALRPRLRHLSLGHPRLEPSGRLDVPAAVRRTSCAPDIVPVAGLVLWRAARRSAQDRLPPAPTDPVDLARSELAAASYGTSDFGGRFQSVDGDEARFQRYRDLRSGVYANNALLRTPHRGLDVRGAGLERRLPRSELQVDYTRVGRLSASFLWDQIPLFISRDTRTLYTRDRAWRVPPRRPDPAGDPGRDERRCATTKTRRRRSTCGRCARSASSTCVFNANRRPTSMLKVRNTTRRRRDPVRRRRSASTTPSSCRCRSTRARPTSRRRSSGPSQKGLLRVGWDGSTFDNHARQRRLGQPATLRAGHRRAAVAGADGALARQQPDLPARHRRHQPAQARPADGLRGARPGPQQRRLYCRSPSTLPSSRSRSSAPPPRPSTQMTIAPGHVVDAPAAALSAQREVPLLGHRRSDAGVRSRRRLGVLRLDLASDRGVRPSITASRGPRFDADGAVEVLPSTAVKVGYSHLAPTTRIASGRRPPRTCSGCRRRPATSW